MSLKAELRTLILFACGALVAGAAAAQPAAVANDCPNDQRIVLTEGAGDGGEPTDRVQVRFEGSNCLCFSTAEAAVQWLTTWTHDLVEGGGDCAVSEGGLLGPLYASPARVSEAELMFGMGGDDPNVARGEFPCYDVDDVLNYCREVESSLKGEAPAD